MRHISNQFIMREKRRDRQRKETLETERARREKIELRRDREERLREKDEK